MAINRIFCLLPLCWLQALHAAPPPTCPAGTPLGSFKISVSHPGGGSPLQLQSINEILPGYKVSYVPANVNSTDRKKARIALVLVPSDHGKILVLDPKPAGEAVEWSVPIRTEIVSLVYGPQGLDKSKITDLIKKNDEVMGQLADYAKKTQETEALIQAITQQQQALDTGQDVNTAVATFANRYNGADRLDPTQTSNQQMLTLIHGVNPALSAYDPLAQSPTQRAAQTAGLAAAVAGLFFGTNVALAASGGAMLVNMHSLIFPGTEFRSAFGAGGGGSEEPDRALREQDSFRVAYRTGISVGHEDSRRGSAGDHHSQAGTFADRGENELPDHGEGSRLEPGGTRAGMEACFCRG